MAELTKEDKEKMQNAINVVSPSGMQDMGLPGISQPPIYKAAAQAYGNVPVNMPPNPLAVGPQMSAPFERLEQPAGEPQTAVPRGGTVVRGTGGVQPELAAARTGGVAQSPKQFGAVTGAQGAAEGISGMFGRVLFPTPEQKALNVASGRTGGIQALTTEAPTLTPEDLVAPADTPALTPEDVAGMSFNGSPLTPESITSPDVPSPMGALEGLEGEEGSPQRAYYDYVAGGGQLTPEKIAEAETYAASMGTTFDPTTGYSRDPFLQSQEPSFVPTTPATPKTASDLVGFKPTYEGQSLSDFLAYRDEPSQATRQTQDPQGRFTRRPVEDQQTVGQPPEGQPSVAPQAQATGALSAEDIRKQAEEGVESQGHYRNIARGQGIKGSAQTAAAKEMREEAIAKRVQRIEDQQSSQAEAQQAQAEAKSEAEKEAFEREEAMIDKQGKLLDQQRTQQIIDQAKSPEATPFQKKRGEWFEREESLREDGASPEEITARRRAFLYGDKFDAWEFGGNGTQPQMETATAAPTVTDEASYNALKTGQKYIHNGKEYTKK